MNVTVTMLQSGRTDDWGRPLVAGSSYSLDFDWAKSLWQAGFASVADPGIFDDSSTPFDGGIVKYARVPGFRRCLLASLVVSSTASRTNGLVTIAATAHGITTGATYQGYRFFYPGSPSLAAGWYDSIVEVATANSLSFSAPGTDFGSESINAAAAYTTQTAFAGTYTVPGKYLVDGSSVSAYLQRVGDATATQKITRLRYGGQIVGAYVGAASSLVSMKHSFSCIGTARQSGNNGAEGVVGNSYYNTTVDQNQDQVIDLTGQVSAAAGFLVLDNFVLEFRQ